jgi:hypothetical protein
MKLKELIALLDVRLAGVLGSALGILGACTPIQHRPTYTPAEVASVVVRDFKTATTALLPTRPGLDVDCARARKLIERSPLSGVYRHGAGFEEQYYASFLQGLVFLRCDTRENSLGRPSSWSESAGAFRTMQTGVGSSPMYWPKSRTTTPPTIRIDHVDYVRWAAHRNEKGEVEVEHIHIRLEGVVSDDNGVTSVEIQGVEVPIKDSGQGRMGTYEYSLEAPEIPVDVRDNKGTFRVVATDSNSNTFDKELPLPGLPSLKLRDSESIYAIVVGVDQYDGAYLDAGGKCREEYTRGCANYAKAKCYKLRTLKYAASDAEDFADLLVARGIPRDHVVTLLSTGSTEGARRADVVAALQRRKSGKAKSFSFFFAGHGSFSFKEEKPDASI